MATLNRESLQQMAAAWLEDAKVLLARGRHAAAYYVAGYAVECALKACFARQVRQYDFPEIGKADQVFVHDFIKLLGLVAFSRAAAKEIEPQTLRAALDEACKKNPALEDHWNTVKVWKPGSRYDPLWMTDPAAMRTKAENMLTAIEDAENGVLPWLARHW